MDDEDFAEAERERQRLLRGGYVYMGIEMSGAHKRWLDGRRAAEEAAQSAALERAHETSGERLPAYASVAAQYQPNSSQSTASAVRENDKSPAKRTIQMYCDQRRQWHQVEALFDTGSPDSWVSQDTADKLEYPIETVETSTYYTFTGDTIDSCQLVRQVRWCIDTGSGPDTRSRYADFRIAPRGAPFAVLFGRDRIFSEDIFRFKEANLILTKVNDTAAVKKARDNKKEQVEAEARALAKEKQSTGATLKQKPLGLGPPEQPNR